MLVKAFVGIEQLLKRLRIKSGINTKKIEPLNFRKNLSLQEGTRGSW